AVAPLIAAAVALAQPVPPPDAIAPQLTAGALKADVSFLASDLLEGRGTPSRGLDVAAEYIAAQFRRAGLEPAGGDGYFQTARYLSIAPKLDRIELELESGGEILKADAKAIGIVQAAAVDLSHATAVKVTAENAAELKDQLRGKVIFLENPDFRALPEAQAANTASEFRRLRSTVENGNPSLVVLVDPDTQRGSAATQLREASGVQRPPVIRLFDSAIREMIAAAKPGPLELTVTAHVPEPSVTPLALHNVIGLLRGSDPTLKDSYVILSAH